MGSSHDSDVVRGEQQVELLGWNAFLITMIGSVAFLAACAYVMMH